MIFYVALDAEGKRQLRGTQADARDVNKAFKQIDIPIDKAGLLKVLQDLMSAADGVAPSEPPAPVAEERPRWNGSPELTGERLAARIAAADHNTFMIAMQSKRMALEEVLENSSEHWVDQILEAAKARKKTFS